MAEDPSAPRGPPPDYGSVETQQPLGYPQPGMGVPPTNPNDPPPKYEPGDMPQTTQPGYQAYPAQPPPGHTTILVQERGFNSGSRLMECPYCHAHITSHTDRTAGALVWLTAGLICLFGCWAGCCLIPFCISDLHDVTHTCPSCERLLGVHRRL